MRKLTYQETQQIREMYENGVSQDAIADIFHVRQSTISALLRRNKEELEPNEIAYFDICQAYPKYRSIFDTVIKRHVAYKRFIGNRLVYDREEVLRAFALYQKILDKEYLDQHQIARVLGVTRQRVVQIFQENALHSVFFGARKYASKQEVYAYRDRKNEPRKKRVSWWGNHAKTG